SRSTLETGGRSMVGQSHSQRIDSLEANVEGLTQNVSSRFDALENRITELHNSQEQTISRILSQAVAEGVAAAQKSLAEQLFATLETEAKKNQEMIDAATERLEGRVIRLREDHNNQVAANIASQKKFQEEIRELLAGFQEKPLDPPPQAAQAAPVYEVIDNMSETREKEKRAEDRPYERGGHSWR
ncbi:hypothetical protein SOVF_215490, partial [Spinacia oleracea]